MDPALLALIAAFVGPIGAYIIAARRFSGKIETSDAKELWAESRAIRDWSQSRIASLTEDVERLERRVRGLEATSDAQAVTITEQREHISKLKIEVTQAKAAESVAQDEVIRLSKEVDVAQQRVRELELEVAGP